MILFSLLWWYSWICFVIFILVAAKSPLRSRVHIHCSYFDDPQVHQTQHIQNWTCVPPKLACLSFILSLIHLVSQHRFIDYLWWSRQCSRHQGCKVEKTDWLQGDLCLVYFLPLPISLMAWGLPRQSPLCIIPHFILHVLSVCCTPLILLLCLFHDLKLECSSALEEASMVFGVWIAHQLQCEFWLNHLGLSVSPWVSY